MLFSILRSNLDAGMKILLLLISVLALLPALSVHEFAHGYAAYKCGDQTAKSMGRLSLNPLAHLDIYGTLMLLLVGFGWAKPVPINSRYFKKPKRDIAIVSLAGPIANFLMALAGSLFFVLTVYIASAMGSVNSATVEIITYFFSYFSMLNIGLGLFNLIPLPPLDGSNVLMCLLPSRLAAKYSEIRYYARYIFLGLILLTWLPYPLNQITDILFYPLNAARTGIYNLFINLWDSVISLFI